MQVKFRKGQTVRCIHPNGDVKRGKLYQVVGYCSYVHSSKGPLVNLKDVGGCFAYRFEPVNVVGTFPFLNPGKGRV